MAGKTRLLVLLDFAAARAIGPLVLCTPRVLLHGNADCTATILYNSKWTSSCLTVFSRGGSCKGPDFQRDHRLFRAN